MHSSTLQLDIRRYGVPGTYCSCTPSYDVVRNFSDLGSWIFDLVIQGFPQLSKIVFNRGHSSL